MSPPDFDAKKSVYTVYVDVLSLSFWSRSNSERGIHIRNISYKQNWLNWYKLFFIWKFW
jgi:hypothetical protein